MTDPDNIAEKVIHKYLRKGNMPRCLRDILPASGLSLSEREYVADIAHNIVRWKKRITHHLQKNNQPPTAHNYIHLIKNNNYQNIESDTFENHYSCSPYVAELLKQDKVKADYLNTKPPTTLCINYNKTTQEHVLTALQNEQYHAQPASLDTAIHSESTARYSSQIKEHHVHIQDESSQLIAHITASLGNTILDYCAGNGGKSLTIASLTRNHHHLTAYDINEKKRTTMNQRFKNYNATITVYPNKPTTKTPVVLVDAPCTGLGAARRNPEAKYCEGPGEYPKKQLMLLHETRQLIPKKGIIIYTVCTFTPEETDHVIATFTEQTHYTIKSMKTSPYNHFLEETRFGAYTTVPQGDIFFISLLQQP